MKNNIKYRVLILTDHSIHSPVESIYHLARAMKVHKNCAHIHVVSRAVPENSSFFASPTLTGPLNAILVNENFQQSEEGECYDSEAFETQLKNYDVVFLRLPRVNSLRFFEQIDSVFPRENIMNRPRGILQTGSKDYLLNFPEFCPPMKFCSSIRDVEEFRKQFSIVLKPLNGSGGQGLIKIAGNHVMDGTRSTTWQDFLPTLSNNISKGYLGMKFLKNVSLGDQRLIMVNGKMVASAIRIPAEGSWLANVSAGASSDISTPKPEEIEMGEKIAAELLKMGIVICGLDTLVNDTGERVLSEINSSCVNGIWPAEFHSGKPVVANTANLLWDYILANMKPL